MGNADMLYRKTALGVVMLFCLMIGSLAVDPYSEASVIARIAMLIIVALLIVGILPGSYLQRRIQAASHKESVFRSGLLRIVGLMAPIVMVALSTLVLFSEYDTLRFIDSTNIATIDRGEVKFNLVRWWALGWVSVFWLVLSARTRFRKRTPRQQTPA
ncbi:MAG TPA: hypothetical protein VI729_10695 [Anaerolineales bacterium]|nr:hypothetical protein [Anaerolineales bacterium]